MKMVTFNTGYCIGPSKAVDPKRRPEKVRFLSRAFLLQTPKHGNILFDTGYAQPYKKHISKWYDWMLPAKFLPGQSVKEQLDALGLAPSDIDYIFVSHFHVDHIAGLADFKGVPWIYRFDALDYLMQCNGFQRMRHGFFKGLVPSIPKGSIALRETDFTSIFRTTQLKSTPLLEDADMVAVDLPGHALGQMGLCLGNTFFVADAAWSQETLYQGVKSSKLALKLQHDGSSYLKTFKHLHNLVITDTQLECIPTHKMEAL